MSETRSSLLRVPGASLHYEVRGAGPILVMLQGGDGDADAAAGIVDHLVNHFTVVTYDRRGLTRSKVDPGFPPPTIETHADDVHHLLEAITREPALVFGASLGALIGLELISRHPNQARLLVAHEPPSTQFLAEAERELAAQSQLDVEETFRRDGIVGAMQKFAAIAAFDPNDREADAKLPAASPQRAANLQFFLTHDAPAARLHRLNLDSLRVASAHVAVGVGAKSGDYLSKVGKPHPLAARCARALAQWLGCEPVDFPGGHNGFVTHPRAFAARLREVLSRRP